MMQYREADAKCVKQYVERQKHDNNQQSKVICLCRDIIQPSSSSNTSKVLSLINKYFDETLIRGDGIFTKLTDSASEWAQIKNITYLGNIIGSLPERQEMPDNMRPVLVNAGGGHDNSDVDFYKNVIRSKIYSSTLSTNPWKVLLSNKMPEGKIMFLGKVVEETNEAIIEKARNSGKPEAEIGLIELSTTIPHNEYAQMISNAAASFTRGSYNNNFELISKNIPYVSVPRPNKTEQLIRAEKVDKLGFGRLVPPERCSPEALAEAIDKEVGERASRRVPKLDFNGAQKMTNHILEIASALQRPLEMGKENHR